jgi:integrase
VQGAPAREPRYRPYCAACNRPLNDAERQRGRCSVPGHREGSCWEFRVELTVPGGQRRQVRRHTDSSGRRLATKADAVRAAAELVGVGPLDRSKVTLRQWLTAWLAEGCGGVDANTVYGYRRAIGRIVRSPVGDVALVRLSRGHVEALVAWMGTPGVREDGKPGGYARTTINSTVIALRAALGAALDHQPPLVVVNAAAARSGRRRDALVRKVTSGVGPLWTQAHLHRFLGSPRVRADIRLYAFYRSLFATGARVSEHFGVTWEGGVSADCRIVSYRQAWTAADQERAVALANPGLPAGSAPRRSGRRVRSEHVSFSEELKTPDSVRDVDVDPGTSDVLRELRESQRFMRGGPVHGLAFVQRDGRPYNYKTEEKRFDALCQEAGVPKIGFHGLRRTNATLLEEARVPTFIIERRLGHTSRSVTGRRYIDLTPGMRRVAVEALTRIIDGPLVDDLGEPGPGGLAGKVSGDVSG